MPRPRGRVGGASAHGGPRATQIALFAWQLKRVFDSYSDAKAAIKEKALQMRRALCDNRLQRRWPSQPRADGEAQAEPQTWP